MSLGAITSRGWVIAGAIAGLVLLVITWLLVMSPVRSEASQLRADTVSVDTQNLATQTRNNQLRDQAKNQKKLSAELEAALAGLPSGPGLPVLSRQLATQAAARGLVLTGVSVGAPTAPVASTPTSATPDAAATTTSETGGALAIPITVTTTGPALQQLFFLRDVQQVGPRRALVTSTSLAPSQGATDTGSSIDDASAMTLQFTVFTNPLSKAERQQLATLAQSATQG